MFCNKCGKKIDNSSKFCCYCGHRIGVTIIEKPVSIPVKEELSEETKSEPIIEIIEESISEVIEVEEEVIVEESNTEEVIEEQPEENVEIIEAEIEEKDETEVVEEESAEEAPVEEVVEESVEEEETLVEEISTENEEPNTLEVIEQPEENEVVVVDAVPEVVVEEVKEQSKQSLTENQEELIEKFKKRKHNKEIKEKVSGGFKVFLNVLWVIFGGLYNAISVIIAGVVECISLVGIPFGIVLFKTVPLMFMPIGKRVVTHYGKHPVANTLWLIFGGFFYALGYTISAILLCLTIVGIPVALQMFKVSNILWAPFGAEILKLNEFSSSENEIIAYTVQYVRKERIIVDLDKLNCDYKQADIIRNICDINCPLTKVFKAEKNHLASTISTVVMVISCVLLYVVFQNFGIIDMISSAIASLGLPEEVLQYGPIALSASILVLIVLFIMIYSISYKIFRTKEAYDYGYATRNELVNMYDNGSKINKNVVNLVYVIYKMYQAEIDVEIRKDNM